MVALFLASSSSPEALWTAAFEEVCERIGPCFARSETREWTKAYLRGLLSPVERKNGWQLAEEATFVLSYHCSIRYFWLGLLPGSPGLASSHNGCSGETGYHRETKVSPTSCATR